MNFRSARYLPGSLMILTAAALLFSAAGRFMILRVQEESMAPTLVDGQWILVERGHSKVESGDLVVFHSPADGRLAVKRCVLVGGERPDVVHGWLTTPWGRWFLSGPQWEQLDRVETIPADSVYLVGDNQFHSMDSRVYGTVSRASLIGRVLMPSGRRANG